MLRAWLTTYNSLSTHWVVYHFCFCRDGNYLLVEWGSRIRVKWVEGLYPPNSSLLLRHDPFWKKLKTKQWGCQWKKPSSLLKGGKSEFILKFTRGSSQLMKTPNSMFQWDNSVMNFYSNKANKENCWSVNRLQKVSAGSLKDDRLETEVGKQWLVRG